MREDKKVSLLKNFEIAIDSFDLYLKLINNNFKNLPVQLDKNILFRGQSESSYNLLPGIARPNCFRDNILKFETDILTEFKRRSIPFLPKTFNTNSDWEWLALAQHFKLPTRLLDWTENPLVALYFAVEKPKKGNQNRVVWVFCTNEDDFADSNNSLINPFKLKNTQVYVPNHMTERIASQSGWFTIHKYIEDDNKFVSLNTNNIYRKRIFKIIIPNKLREEILVKLDRLGVNAFSIYPDLDGLSEFLTWKYFK